MGTPDFAATVLDALLKNGENVVGVVSQPDKPKNRGMKFVKTPVKECAEQYNIPVFQPETLKDGAIAPLLEELKPDIIIVVAYGRILPAYVLEYPKHRCVNVHASLLPRHRGAAPIQWSIICGDKVTGVTTMYMEKGLDTGDMILKRETPILPDDTAETLFDRLAVLGGEIIIDTLKRIKDGTVTAEKQNEEEATYASMLDKAMGDIDWTDSAENIYNKIRGLYPWPCAYTHIGEKKFKVLSASVCDGKSDKVPGTVIEVGDVIKVQTGDKLLSVSEVQFDGKRKMNVADYLRGNKDIIKESAVLHKF